MQQLAGGIVDIDEQGAFGTAVLEPPMKRAIDLDEFAETIAPAARLENPLLALASRHPDAGFHHPLTQRLLADGNPVAFEQLLSRQGWSEIRIMLTHQVEHQVAEILAMTPVARPAALLRDQPVGAGQVIGLQQPMHLTAAEAEQFGRLDDAQAAAANPLDQFKTMQFLLRHGDQTRHDDSERSWSQPRFTSPVFLPNVDV